MFLKNFGCCFLTGQYNSEKKRLVRLAVLSGWHYQDKSYPVVEIGCDSSIIMSFFKILFKFYFERLFKIIKKRFITMSLIYLLFDLFCDNNNIYSRPPPPPPPLLSLQTEIVVQFYPWSKCYFLLFSTHYHTLPYPKTYLPWQHGKSQSRDANLSCRFWRLSIFHLPLPNLSTAPLPHPHPILPHPTPKLTQPPKGIV